MPTRTDSKAGFLMARVPVDEFEIHKGPAVADFLEAKFYLDCEPAVELFFSLRTAASATTFGASLYVSKIVHVKWATYSFEASFNGTRVAGIYDTDTQTGSFGLE